VNELLKQEWKLAERGVPSTSPTAGARNRPGPVLGPFTARWDGMQHFEAEHDVRGHQVLVGLPPALFRVAPAAVRLLQLQQLARDLVPPSDLPAALEPECVHPRGEQGFGEQVQVVVVPLGTMAGFSSRV